MLSNEIQRATRNTRSTACFRKVIGNIGSASNSKFDRSNGVLVRGGFRKHRGSGSKPQAASKMQAHIKYLAGDKHKQEEKEKRELFDDRGLAIDTNTPQKNHDDAFIEHRIIISPGGNNTQKSDLHILSQSMIAEIRERNPKAEISASYAIHTDTKHPHSHVLITSPNFVKLDKDFYFEMRQEMKDLKDILEQERSQGREHSHTIQNALLDDIKQDFQQEMGQSR